MRKLALCIGINNYPGVENDLRGCVNDACDWQAFLAARGFEVTTLLDRQATFTNVTAHLERVLVGALAAEDQFVLTYSGHGTWVPDTSGDEPDGRDEALVLFDSHSAGLLLDDTLSALFAARARGSLVTFVSDSCHSGTVLRAAPAGAPRRVRTISPREVGDPVLAAAAPAVRPPRALRTGSMPGVVHFAGCKDTEYSYDASFGGRPNGAMTRVMLDALAASPRDVTAAGVFRLVRASLPSIDFPQTPQLSVPRALRDAPAFR